MRFFLGICLWAYAAFAMANPPPSPAISTAAAINQPSVNEVAEPDQPFSAEDGELVPTSVYTAKKPYDHGLELLQNAEEFWKQKQYLKASDTSLEAFDDLMDVHLPRRHRKARRKLEAERHQTAEVYVESSIAFIKQDAEKAGNTSDAKREARARLGDLRDVSREYLELQKMLVNAIMELQ